MTKAKTPATRIGSFWVQINAPMASRLAGWVTAVSPTTRPSRAPSSGLPSASWRTSHASRETCIYFGGDVTRWKVTGSYYLNRVLALESRRM